MDAMTTPELDGIRAVLDEQELAKLLSLRLTDKQRRTAVISAQVAILHHVIGTAPLPDATDPENWDLVATGLREAATSLDALATAYEQADGSRVIRMWSAQAKKDES